MTSPTPSQAVNVARPSLRTDGDSVEIEFRPGEWAQACAFFTTTWSYPDREGNNKALEAACEGLPDLIVRAVNSHDELLAVAVDSLAIARNLREVIRGIVSKSQLENRTNAALARLSIEFTNKAESAIRKATNEN